MIVTKDSILFKTIKLNKDVQEILKKYGMKNCIDCKGSRTETIAYAAAQHGVDVSKIVKDINDLLKNEKK